MQKPEHHPHSNPSKQIGVLLTNLGTPDAPTTSAVRKYLKEFLSDSRVIEIPRLIWLPILYGIILPFRSPRSAKLYQKIWSTTGSPLRSILDQQAKALNQQLADYRIVPAMRYGNPSIAAGLATLRKHNIQKILLFPLYPQYSATTIATTFDKVTDILKTWRWQPELRTIHGYHDNPNYISAVANSIENYWKNHGKTTKLLFSFHGLPKQFLLKGDPYYCFCHKTARLIAEQLQLANEEWQLTFQSRLGKAEWSTPYTDKTVIQLAQQGIKDITVVCPGFSADCLETLEEIQQLNKELFLHAGGKSFHYIPALNTDTAHIELLSQLIRQHTQGW